jgi:hypothetical protein
MLKEAEGDVPVAELQILPARGSFPFSRNDILSPLAL